MKKFFALKAAISVLLALIISVSAMPLGALGAQSVYIPKSYYAATPFDGVITPELHRYLTKQVSLGVTKIDVEDFNIPWEDCSTVITYVYYEIPEAFAVSGCGASGLGNKTVSINASYDYTPTEIKSMLGECEAVADNMVKDIKSSNLSKAEKALLLHDRLALHTEYDYQNYLNGTLPNSSYDMYGALARGFSVCQGYAMAYMYLLSRVGIESDYCSSTTLNHGWNIVYIDGSSYYTDVTWDDKVWDISGRVSHENFLKSFEAFNHNANDYTVIPTDTRYDDYYWNTVETAFQYAGGQLYYIDSEDSYIKKASDKSRLKSVYAKWPADRYSNWVGNFSRLASDGDNLIYNLNDAVYRYNPAYDTTEKIYTPDLDSYGEYYSIYGLKLSGDQLTVELYNYPNFKNKQETVIKLDYEKPEPQIPNGAGDINGDGKVTLSDVSVLAQSVAGWKGLTLKENALDVNGDGKTTLSDVSHLAQYVAGWQGIMLYIK